MIEARLKDKARSLGFELVGIARADEAEDYELFQRWLASGQAGAMGYLERQAAARRHPDAILPGVRSVVMVGLNYKPPADTAPPESMAKVARYARGGDYHDVLWRKLDELLDWVRQQAPSVKGRGVVDTAPLLERGFARRAGLGWVAKNTMLINKSLGSYFFLGALLLNLDLLPDGPFEADHCGTCTACLQACPTDAFPKAYELDARRCISYLTIELRGPIAEDLRPGMGEWVFGCDICQEVCPWNRKAPAGVEAALQPRPELECPDAEGWVNLSEEDYRQLFRGTALTRPKREGLRRNAAIVLGNRGNSAALPALERAAQDDSPTVRDAARWASDQIRSRENVASAP